MRFKFCFSLSLICLLFLSCNKERIEEKDFTIHIKFPIGYFYDGATVVITDDNGNFINSFKAETNNSLETLQKIKLNSKINSVQVHLGVKFENSPIQIFTHLDVQDGETISFFLGPDTYDGTPLLQKCLRVHGIQTLDSIGILGESINTPKEPTDNSAVTCSVIFPNQGMVVHAKANNESQYRYLYLSDSVMKSAPSLTEINYDDLIQNPPIKHFSVPPGFDSIVSIDVNAVSTDFNSFVSLGPGPNFDLNDLYFVCPESAPKNYRIKVQGRTGVLDQIFYENEPLTIQPSNISLSDISSTPGVGFKISSQGDIDLMEVICNESSFYRWTIQGTPEAFKEVTLPSLDLLKKYISIKTPFPTPFWRFEVRAHAFGKHNYSDLAEGWPFLSGKYFEVPKSGYSMIRVWYE